VPVGEDQRQHLELTRDLAMRFNHHYGETFVIPQLAMPEVAARVMDLQEPTRKMSKSVSSPLGTIGVLDTSEEIDRKIRRAVTDAGSDVVYDPLTKPGVSNLLELLAAAKGGDPEELAAGYSSYSQLKSDVSEALVELLRPVRERHLELAADRAHVEAVLAEGATKAHAVAGATLDRAMRAVGLFAPRGGFTT